MFIMSWDTHPTIKELPLMLEIILWRHSSFHWRSGQWQHLSRQGKVDAMFHLRRQAHSSQAGHGPLLPPRRPCLLAVPCLWGTGNHHYSSNFDYSTVGEKTVAAYLICQPIYGNIESCQKWQRKHLLWFRVPAFYLVDARDSKSVNK